MAEISKIQWTDATWNPATGCTKISEGCRNCYADILAQKLQKMNPNGRYRNGFKLTLHEDVLGLPLKWREPKKIFVNSMSDLFHRDVPDEFIEKVWAIMNVTPQHTYQILTKRPERMEEFVNKLDPDEFGYDDLLPNVWLGTSIENKESVGRINYLRRCKAKVRFISFEPLIDDVGELNLSGIHWVIVGGESGQGHRLIKEEWVQNILNQCRKQKVAFFFKQWGGRTPKSGGRDLNGRTYSEYPQK